MDLGLSVRRKEQRDDPPRLHPNPEPRSLSQTRLRVLALEIEFVLRHTNLERWLPMMAHGLRTVG
jgi:hypothetical protein